MATSKQGSTHLYKILPSSMELPVPLPRTSIIPKTSVDVDSGFIHFSTSSQVPYVLHRFFNTPETRNVWLVKINYAGLASNGDVRWEGAGTDGSSFAHLYGGEVTGEVVDDVKQLDRGNNNDWDSSLQGLTEDGWLT